MLNRLNSDSTDSRDEEVFDKLILADENETFLNIHEAAYTGAIGALTSLVSLNPDPNMIVNLKHSENGDTPLIAACRGNQLEAAHYLLEAGAETTINDRNNENLSAFDIASQNKNEVLITLLRTYHAEEPQSIGEAKENTSEKAKTSFLAILFYPINLLKYFFQSVYQFLINILSSKAHSHHSSEKLKDSEPNPSSDSDRDVNLNKNTGSSLMNDKPVSDTILGQANPVNKFKK